MFWPTMMIPLDHVLGAEADPQIERKLWKAWAFGTPGEYCVPEPGVRFYDPRHFCAHKAIVIRLQDESCERLVVAVEDSEGLERCAKQLMECGCYGHEYLGWFGHCGCAPSVS